MANNKIQLSDGTVLLDLTADTAIAADVAQGKTFHLASGAAAVGTNTGGGTWPPSTIAAGDTPVIISTQLGGEVASTRMTDTGVSLTVPKSGTYRIKFSAAKTSSTGTFTAQLYKNGVAISGATAAWNNHLATYNGSQTLNANDTISIYALSRSTAYPIMVSALVACIDGDNGF